MIHFLKLFQKLTSQIFQLMNLYLQSLTWVKIEFVVNWGSEMLDFRKTWRALFS